MAKWNFRLKSGSALREAIEDATTFDGEASMESMALVLNRLEQCCTEAIELMHKPEWEYDRDRFDDLLSTLDGEAQTVREKPCDILSWGFTGVDALVQMRLEEFWDICDSTRVWVEF